MVPIAYSNPLLRTWTKRKVKYIAFSPDSLVSETKEGPQNRLAPSLDQETGTCKLTMPLVDDHQLKKHDEGVGKAREVVLAVLVLDKVGAIQVQITAIVDGRRECLSLNGLAKDLHANHGVDVVNSEQEHAIGDKRGRDDGNRCYDCSKSCKSQTKQTV